jgi:hypothetical protein
LQKGLKELLDELTNYSEVQLRVTSVDSSDWNLIINVKWQLIGVILAQLGAFKWARLVYEREYSVLCRIQFEKGRVHKGTPLHQIGWVALLENTPESLVQSRYFIKLAMIEDCLTFGDQYRRMPAFRVLNEAHQIAEPVLRKFADSVMKWVHSANFIPDAERRSGSNQERGQPAFDVFRPELIYLDVIRESGGSEESDYFKFDSQIAEYLLEEVEDGKGATARSKAK